MGIEHLSPLPLTHTEASSETLREMFESFDDFEAADLESLLTRFLEEDSDA